MTPEEAIKQLEFDRAMILFDPTTGEEITPEILKALNGDNYRAYVADGVAIAALKEIQQYREMDKKLREAYGDCDGLLAIAVEGLCKHPGINIGEPIKARLLIDEDVDKWDAYREIGTVEECKEAVEKQKPKKCDITKDNFRFYYKCSTCNHNIRTEYIGGSWLGKKLKHCSYCGQTIRWDNESLEGMGDE